MTKLSKYEKETIINWNEAEDTASIYTFNADLKRRLAEFSRKYPQLCRLERSTTEGSVTYVMDKSRLSIRLVPPYSEERLTAAREYAKQHGFQAARALLCRCEFHPEPALSPGFPPAGRWPGARLRFAKKRRRKTERHTPQAGHRKIARVLA